MQKLKLRATIMEVMCYRCEKKIVDDDEAFECDGCCYTYHIKCEKVPKKEHNTRLTSNCLRLFCDKCITSPTDISAENIKMIKKFMFKFDVYNQNMFQRKGYEDDKINSIIAKMNEMSENISKLQNLCEQTNTDENKNAQSYARVVKQSNVKPVVVIKPKDKKKSKETLADITKKIDVKDVDVCNTRNTKNGGIVLSCKNSTETVKMKQLMENKFGDSYEVILPKIKRPRLRITNIDESIPVDDIITELKDNNKEFDLNMQVITTIKKKKKDNSWTDIIVEVDCNTYKYLMSTGKLKLRWNECLIYDHIYIQRCYKCCGFSHQAKACTKKQACSKCAQQHSYDKCDNDVHACINCMVSNQKMNTNFDFNHHAYSRECPILQHRFDRLQSKIEYSDNEK